VTFSREHFWQQANELLAASEIIIDRPRRSSYPRYPDGRYPLNYRFLAQTGAGDGSDIDVWVGSLPERRVTGAIATIDALKRDAEVKLLISCTREEVAKVTQVRLTPDGYRSLNLVFEHLRKRQA
jgi:inorganic pyrophosphatase